MTEEIFSRIISSKKYSGLCEDTIRRVTEDACRRYKKAKDAEKSARETLHGITGAFMGAEELKHARELMKAGAFDEVLKLHSSTRERIPLDPFYEELFIHTGKPSHVLDIACGLNPYYLGGIGIKVTGIDINAHLMDALNEWAAGSGTPVTAYSHDVLSGKPLPDGDYDLALIMKLLPVLETQKKGSALELLRIIPAPRMAVTFPTRTLGGRKVGMDRHYSQWFESILTDEFSIGSRYTMNNELIYVLDKKL